MSLAFREGPGRSEMLGAIWRGILSGWLELRTVSVERRYEGEALPMLSTLSAWSHEAAAAKLAPRRARGRYRKAAGEV